MAIEATFRGLLAGYRTDPKTSFDKTPLCM